MKKFMKLFMKAMQTHPLAFLIGFIIFTICGSIFQKTLLHFYEALKY